MNQHTSGDLWLEYHVVFAGEFLEEMLFCLSDFLFIFFESLFDIGDSVHHQAPEQLSQLSSQGQIGDQSALASLDSPIEATQGLVQTAPDAPRNHAEQPSAAEDDS